MLIKTENQTTVNDSSVVVEIMNTIYKNRPVEEKHKEYFYVIGMDIKNRIKYIDLNAIGTISSCNIYIREILRLAIIKNISSIILCHNHPSGDFTPSQADYLLTQKVKDACKLLEINLLDHIIVTPKNGYYSFADNFILD